VSGWLEGTLSPARRGCTPSTSETAQASFDHEIDFLIVGSGAGAMTAGIIAADQDASVLLIEKSPQYGGSSAMSGGGLWVPNNHMMEAAGFSDTPEAALYGDR